MQPITDYVAGLKQLAAGCEFGNFVSEALRDIFVIGIQEVETQKKLRSEKDLTFQKAMEIPLSREALSRDFLSTGGRGWVGGVPVACTSSKLTAATRTVEADKGRAEVSHIQGTVPQRPGGRPGTDGH